MRNMVGGSVTSSGIRAAHSRINVLKFYRTAVSSPEIAEEAVSRAADAEQAEYASLNLATTSIRIWAGTAMADAYQGPLADRAAAFR